MQPTLLGHRCVMVKVIGSPTLTVPGFAVLSIQKSWCKAAGDGLRPGRLAHPEQHHPANHEHGQQRGRDQTSWPPAHRYIVGISIRLLSDFDQRRPAYLGPPLA